ncbi:MAG: prepilin-type N-terminal cleavage/methylation domain-containing protein [Thermodesulfobacteriota bacterium]
MKKSNRSRGFTLTEVLIVLLILGLILTVCCRLFLSQAEAHKNQNGNLQGQQNLRNALEIMARDIKGVGYPELPSFFTTGLSNWIAPSFISRLPDPVVLQDLVTVTPGNGGPDRVSLLLLLSSSTNPTVLAQAALPGDTLLRLALNGSELDDQYNIGDVIYVGKPAEPAVVTQISRTFLSVDTDPLQPGAQGLKKGYAQNTEVGELSLISYAIFNDQNDPGGNYHDIGMPVLKRKTNGGGFEPLVEDITDLKVQPMTPGLFRLELSLRTPPPRQSREKIITLQTRLKKNH